MGGGASKGKGKYTSALDDRYEKSKEKHIQRRAEKEVADAEKAKLAEQQRVEAQKKREKFEKNVGKS